MESTDNVVWHNIGGGMAEGYRRGSTTGATTVFRRPVVDGNGYDVHEWVEDGMSICCSCGYQAKRFISYNPRASWYHRHIDRLVAATHRRGQQKTQSNRLRDSQRSKVYAAETYAYRNTDSTRAERLTLTEMRQLADEILTHPDVTRAIRHNVTAVRVDLARSNARHSWVRWSGATTPHIEVAHTQPRTDTIVHEVCHVLAAHHAALTLKRKIADHGPEFAAVLLAVTIKFCSVAYAEKLIEGYKINGVKVDRQLYAELWRSMNARNAAA